MILPQIGITRFAYKTDHRISMHDYMEQLRLIEEQEITYFH